MARNAANRFAGTVRSALQPVAGRFALNNSGLDPRQELFVAKSVATRSVDLEAIDRLEEKLKLLVGAIERLRNEGSRMADDNARLVRELDATRARLADAEGSSSELTALREERGLIRDRVSEMLQQIESLSL
jgi:regulator of replication initiation timing